MYDWDAQIQSSSPPKHEHGVIARLATRQQRHLAALHAPTAAPNLDQNGENRQRGTNCFSKKCSLLTRGSPRCL